LSKKGYSHAVLGLVEALVLEYQGSSAVIGGAALRDVDRRSHQDRVSGRRQLWLQTC
jgi:hypothetical protein